MQPITQDRASKSKHHWLYPSSNLSTSPWQHNCQPCNAVDSSRMATRFFVGIHFQVRTICTPRESVNVLKTGANRLWSSWKVAWSKHVSMIRAWSSPDSNKVTNDDSLGDWRAAQGIWRSWHLFLSSSSIVLKGVLCSFLFSFSKRSKYKPNLKVTFLNNLLNHQFLHSWREMKYWHADVQLYNSVKHGYTGMYIPMQKTI